MGNLVFPALSGLKWDRKKTPEWSTKVQRTASGKESRVSFFSSPLWNFSLTYEFLRTDHTFDELKSIVQLFNSCKGSFDTFLFSDPYDRTVVGQVIGYGDGTTASFQLLRNNMGVIENVVSVDYSDSLQSIEAVTLISEITSFTAIKFYINGVENYHNSTSSTGVLTFNIAPQLNDVISWTGQFYYRCRFKEDMMEFNNFMLNLWEAKKVEFVSVK